MTSLFIVSTCFFALWLLSVRRADSSLVDLLWGPAFVIVFWSEVTRLGANPRSLLLGALLSVWALRLFSYLAWRNLGKGEDARYTRMRHKAGPSWWWRSLFQVFALQCALVWCISMPVRSVASDRFGGWSPLDLLATALVITGLAFETIGDLQLAAFKKINPGQLMTTGLWSWTRHPNYFGDALVWWGFGLFALTGGHWFTLLGPLVMTVLLVRVSGKALLEKTMQKREGWAEYAKATSGFVPWPPRSRRN